MKVQLTVLPKEVAVLKAQATTLVTNTRTVTSPPTSNTRITGHAVNTATAGFTCPTRITKHGVGQFFNPQQCSHCGKKDYHILQDCFSLPQNASKKAEFTANRRTRKQKRVVSRGINLSFGQLGRAEQRPSSVATRPQLLLTPRL